MPSLGPFLNSQKSQPHFLTHVFFTCGPVLYLGVVVYNVKKGAAARLRSRFAVKHGTFEEQASIGGLYRVHNSILLPLP